MSCYRQCRRGLVEFFWHSVFKQYPKRKEILVLHRAEDSGGLSLPAQENGDIFAFDEPFNNLFKHAVPPEDEGVANSSRN